MKKGGEIVIGDYNEFHNPSQDYVEIFDGRHLIQRTGEELVDFANQVGFMVKNIKMGNGEENVNLFMHEKLDQ